MTIFRTKHATLAMAISSALALSACGGDSGAVGGGNEGVVQPGGVIITGIDGYLKNALLCADDNNNGKCEAGEVIKDLKGNALLTDENGHIDAKISQADEKRLETSPRLIATIQSLDSDAELFTEDTDMPGQAMKAVVLRTPAGSEIASPMTDLVVSKMQATEGLSEEDAKKEVLASMEGLDSATAMDENVLFGDYIVAKTAGDDASKALAVKIHKTAQILTETKANASSDEAFDAQLEQVVEATVGATATMNPEELGDETYKPYVPVAEEPSTEPPVIVTNFAVKFDAVEVATLASQVRALEGVYGDVDMWGHDTVIDVVIADLIIDKDNQPNTVSIANDTDLRKANLAVTLANDTLTIARVQADKAVAKGTYKIQLATNDLNSNGDVVSEKIISATTLDLTVESYNYAPEIADQEIADKLALDILAVKLEQHAPINASFDITGLFIDKNGDVLNYSVSTTIPGVSANINGTLITLSGAPTTAPKDGQLVITAKDGVNQIEVRYPFSEVTPVITNDLRDLLVGESKTWYRWNGDQKESNGATYHFANCMALKFVAGENKNTGTFFVTDGKQCPQESEVTTAVGSWEANAEGHVVVTSPEGSTMTFTGFAKPHEADPRQPRVTIFEREEKAKLTREINGATKLTTETFESGATFFKNRDAALNYWNDAEGSIWAMGKDVKIDLSARHGQFTEHEKFDYIDVDLYFNGVKCTELGLVENEHGSFDPVSPGSRYEWFRITGDALNGNPLYFNAFEKGFVAFETSEGCAVNLDITKEMAMQMGVDFAAGQALTVYGSEAKNIGDEEFIINTFIDRDFSIEPKHDLIIDAEGIYFVDGMTVGYVSEFNGEIIEEFTDYDPTSDSWTTWAAFEGEQTITAYQATNGNHAYQFWNKGDGSNGDESFTIWADTAGTMSMKDAGSVNVETQQYFLSEAEAKQSVIDSLQPMVFTNTDWKSQSNNTMSFTSTNVTYNGVEMLRTDLPADHPACMMDEKQTCYAGTGIAVNFCDDELADASNCPEADSYHVTWDFLDVNNMKRVKTHISGGYSSTESWVKQ